MTAPRQAAIVVYVTDPERGPQADEAAICRYFGLTPAEGAVVLAIARGRSLAEVASATRQLARHRAHARQAEPREGRVSDGRPTWCVSSCRAPSGLGLAARIDVATRRRRGASAGRPASAITADTPMFSRERRQRIRRGHDHGNSRQPLVAELLGAEVPAIHSRHRQVENHQARPARRCAAW
jgi:hypothetical protein